MINGISSSSDGQTFLIIVVIIVICAVRNIGDGLVGGCRAELSAVLLRWNEVKSQPVANAENFMRAFPPYLVSSNRLFVFGRTNYVSMFANTRISTGGTLFVSSNGVFILVDLKGIARVLR